MTIVVAYPFEGQTVLAADTLVSSGGVVWGNLTKLVYIHGEALAFAGELGPCQDLARRLDTLRGGPTAIRDHVLEGSPKYAGCEFVHVYGGGRITTIDGDGATLDPPGAVALGSGTFSALGYLAGADTPATLDEAQTLVESAIEYTCTVHTDCGGSIHSVIV